LKDGIIEQYACPPLRAVLDMMVYGHYNGKSIQDPEIRSKFTGENRIKSKYYHARLLKKQSHDIDLWSHHIEYLETFLNRPGYEVEAGRLKISDRLDEATKKLEFVSTGSAPLEQILSTVDMQW
jgi:hypothetical protein